MIQKYYPLLFWHSVPLALALFLVAEGQQYSRMGRPVKEAPMVVEFFVLLSTLHGIFS